MVYSGNGITYSELKGMDLAEYREAVEAKLLYMEKWLPEAREKAKADSSSRIFRGLLLFPRR